MGVGYGSIQEPVQLNKKRIGRETAQELTWFQRYGMVLLTFFEIAANAIPIIGPSISAGLAATQAGIMTSEEIERVNTAREQGQDAKLNTAALGIAWGATLFAGGSAFAELGAGLSTASRIQAPIGQVSSDLTGAIDALVERTGRLAASTQTIGGEFLAEGASSTISFGNLAFGSSGEFTTGNMGRLLSNLEQRYTTMGSQFQKLQRYANRKFISGSELSNLNNLIGEIKGGANFFNASTKELQDAFLFARSGELAGEGTEEFTEAQNKLTRVLSPAQLDELLTILTEAGGGSIIGFRYKINKFLKGLSRVQLNELQEVSQTIVKSNKVKKLFIKMANQPRGLAVLNAASLYQNEVQWVQNINGSDMGRWGAEKIYHGLKGQVEAWAGSLRGNRLLKKVVRKLNKALDATTELEQAFVKTGGVIIASKYIWGIKVINRGEKIGYSKRKVGGKSQPRYAQHQVLVKFNPATTSSKSGKNKGGKHDVVVYMSTKDLEHMITEGSAYWFRVGKKKGWFVSRGGKARYGTEVKGWGALPISGSVSAMLAILPIQAIRSLGSIMSNVKAAYGDIKKANGFGGWLNNYMGELEKNFSNTGINRAGRLLARGVIGTVLGRWAGRASQQFITATINTTKKHAKKYTWSQAYAKNLFGRGGMLGKRFMSDTKSLTRAVSGRNTQALTTGRRLGIAMGAPGRGTKASPGWFGGW